MGAADYSAVEGVSSRSPSRNARTEVADERAAAAAALHAACGAFPRRGDAPRFSDDGEVPVAYHVPNEVLAAIRAAVGAFVATRRRDHLPPERVIVELMQAINIDPLKHDYGREQTALRETVFAGFLAAYYAARAD